MDKLRFTFVSDPDHKKPYVEFWYQSNLFARVEQDSGKAVITFTDSVQELAKRPFSWQEFYDMVLEAKNCVQ